MKRIKIKRLRCLLRCDWRRYRAWSLAGETGCSGVFPAFVCVLLFRLSAVFFQAGCPVFSRFFWLLNSYATGADLAPHVRIGPGLLIPFPAGVSVECSAGRNLTIMALSGIGADFSDESRPRLGNNVFLAFHSGVFGNAVVGDNASILPGCMVSGEIAADVAVAGHSLKFRHLTPVFHPRS